MAPCWKLKTSRGNSHVRRIPKTPRNGLHTRRPSRQGETPRALRHRIYGTLRKISMAGNRHRDMRITQLQPTIDWTRVWKNLHATWSSDVVKAVCYTVIHDILPTNERLYTIRLNGSKLCRTCGEKDTCLHQITECGEGKAIWKWARKRIAWILRTDPSRIPQEWFLRPQFQIWPPRRHRIVLWILAHIGWFKMWERRAPSSQAAGRCGKHIRRPDV
jgi:hypothetical protein